MLAQHIFLISLDQLLRVRDSNLLLKIGSAAFSPFCRDVLSDLFLPCKQCQDTGGQGGNESHTVHKAGRSASPNFRFRSFASST